MFFSGSPGRHQHPAAVGGLRSLHPTPRAGLYAAALGRTESGLAAEWTNASGWIGFVMQLVRRRQNRSLAFSLAF